MKIQIALATVVAALTLSSAAQAGKLQYGKQTYATATAAAASAGAKAINHAVPAQLRDLWRPSTSKTVKVVNVRNVVANKPSPEFSVTTNPKPGRYDNRDLSGSALVKVLKIGNRYKVAVETAQQNTYE